MAVNPRSVPTYDTTLGGALPASIHKQGSSSRSTKRLVACVDDDGADVNPWGDDASPSAPPFSSSSSTSAVAALTRELKALEVRYFRTREQLDKVGERSDHVRLEMAKVRAENQKLVRAHTHVRHLLDRVQCEKKQVEAQAMSNRDYAKKIETKFFQGTPKTQLQTLVQSHREMAAKIKSLEAQLLTTKDSNVAKQRELKEANDKVGILKRALETRLEQLQLNGSIHAGVLFELAKLQDQTASMALQLGEERKLSKALEVQLEASRARHTQLAEHVVVREAWLASVEKERVELADKLAASDNDRQTAAFEKATLLRFIQEQAEAKLQLEAELKRLQDAKFQEAEVSQAKLQQSMEDKQHLQATTNDLLLQLERTQQEAQRNEHALTQEQQTTEELRARQHELFLDIQRLQDDDRRKDDQLHAAHKVHRQLQTTIDSQQQHERELVARVEELEAMVSALEQEIVQRQEEEGAVRTAMENALQDLETLSRQRNDAARAMNEAVTISASSLEEQQVLEAKLETQRKQVEQLKHSKNLLQNAMLEQLSALRKQLQIERLQRIELEAKLKQQLGGPGSIDAVDGPNGGGGGGGGGGGKGGGRGASPVTPTPSMDSMSGYEDLQLEPLPPPPERSARTSPVPPHHVVMLQRQQSTPLFKPPSSSLEPLVGGVGTPPSPPPPPFAPPTRGIEEASTIERTPERTTISVPSPTDSLSLLDLAGVE